MTAGPEPGDEATVVELLLGEGSPATQQALRDRVAAEPLLALELAETVALLEGFRQLRTAPSPQFGCRLHDVVRRAERLPPASPPMPWIASAAWLLAAAAVVFALLWQLDPLGRRAAPALVRATARIEAAAAARGLLADPAPTEAVLPVVRESGELAWAEALETMRLRLGMETSRRLEQAFEDALRPPVDPLQRWLDPRNALASLRARHELLARPEARRAALRHQGGLVAVDERVQELARRLTADLQRLPLAPAAAELGAVALAMRALIAAGAVDDQRLAALELGGDWLAAQLPRATGPTLVTGLAPLVELAAVTGRYGELVAEHGRRLVDEVLRTDADNWGRWRPELLAGRVPAAVMADAARLLRWLPGVGVDAARCHLVRQLVLGRLRERRDAGDDGPELLAAMLYGGADLLGAAERDEVERQLRRWTPLRLAPDYVTVHQLTWGFEPGRLGFTRLQRELRRLAVLPDPGAMGPRAAYCLCLATQYAAWPDHDAIAGE